jgi:hypothetical protein
MKIATNTWAGKGQLGMSLGSRLRNSSRVMAWLPAVRPDLAVHWQPVLPV